MWENLKQSSWKRKLKACYVCEKRRIQVSKYICAVLLLGKLQREKSSNKKLLKNKRENGNLPG